MRRKRVVVTRPFQWAWMTSDKLDIVYADIGGGEPVRLRNGKPCADSVGGVITPKGAQNLVRVFTEHCPDVFLWWAHYMPEPKQRGDKYKLANFVKLLEQLRKINKGTLFLYGNGNQQGTPDFNIQAFGHLIDGILINTRDKREVHMYQSHGIKAVRTLHTFGFDPAEHGHRGAEPIHDCFFGGSQTLNVKTGKPSKFYPKNSMLGGKYPNSRGRWEFLEAVAERHDLMVCGKGKNWPAGVKAYPYQYGEDYYRVFARAKICLGYYHWDLTRYYTKRTVYSGASGRLLVTRYIPEMEKDFENHKNIVWFRDNAEGVDLVGRYLADEKLREQVARQQQEHFVERHSWHARLREFERIVEELV